MAAATNTSLVKFSGIVLWILSSAWQYGFHISALNASEASLTCEVKLNSFIQLNTGGVGGAVGGLFGLVTCIPMSQFGFGVLTSAFTIGGLISSLNTARLADQAGRKQAGVYAAWLIVLGTFAMAFGSSLTVLIFGRFTVGLASGIATVLVPLFLSEIAPVKIRGSVGVLTQLSICFGLSNAQGISIPLSTPNTGYWRIIPLVSGGVALVQILMAKTMVESPFWLAEQRKNSRVFDIPDDDNEEVIRHTDDLEADSDDPLLSRNHPEIVEDSMTLGEVFNSKEAAVQKGLRSAVLTQAFQQCSGINAVMYYSTGILSAINPASAKYVAFFVTIVNLVMSIPAVYLIDRLGRRSLLMISLSTMSISSIVLGWSINSAQFNIASIFIVLFVACFSLGLGPIPFVLMGEVPPPKARAASASAGLGTNWGFNALVGLTFLPIRDFISGGAPEKSGSVFFIFAIISALGCVVMSKLISR